MKPAEVAASIMPSDWPISVAATMNGSDGRLQQRGGDRPSPVELAAIDQRRQPAGDQQRGDEGRYRDDRRGAREQGVEIEAHAAGDEEDRHEDAEAHRGELGTELRMGHRLVLVEVVDDRPRRERTQDQLEAELLGEHGHSDQEHERAADADLSAGVLKPDERSGDPRRALDAHHADQHRGDREHEQADQQELCPRGSARLAGETGTRAAAPRRSRRSTRRRSPAARTASSSRPRPAGRGRSPRGRSR